MTDAASTTSTHHRSRRWPGRLLIAVGLLSSLPITTGTRTATVSDSTAYMAGYLMGRLLLPLCLILWGLLLLHRDTKRQTQDPR